MTVNMMKYLKMCYIKLLLPYEARYGCGGVDPETLIEAGRVVAESPEYRERNRDKLVQVPVKPDRSKKEKREPSPPRNEFGWFICDVCQAVTAPDGAAPTFTRMQSLVRHKHDKHGEPVTPGPGRNKFSCHENGCRFTSHRPEQLVTHLGEVHKLPGFAISQEEFRSGKELHEWKLLKMEATNSALLNYSWNSQFVSSVNGTMTYRENCFRNPRREYASARVKHPRCKSDRTGVVRTDCPAFMKETCFSLGSLEPGSPRIQVQFCLTHYGHDPQKDVARVQRRLKYLKKQGPKLLDVDDPLPMNPDENMLLTDNSAEVDDSPLLINADDSLLSTENFTEATDTFDQYSIIARQNSGTIPDFEPISLPVFEPIPLASFEVENSVDPDTGRLNGESVEIHRCHASIVLALKDIADSGAEETLTELQYLERRAVVARAKVIHSKKMADEDHEKQIAKEERRKRKLELHKEKRQNPKEYFLENKKLRSFLTGDGVRFHYYQ